MANQHQFLILITNVNAPNGPQIVLPSFRPISLYEIEDNYEELVQEVQATIDDPLVVNELEFFLSAFRESLNAKNIRPLMDYFVINHGGRIDLDALHPALEALSGFIDNVTDINRKMS